MSDESNMRMIAKMSVFLSSRNLPVIRLSSIFAWNSTHGIALAGSIGER